MLLSESLRDEWRECGRSHPFEPALTLNNEGLVLGAGTILAKRRYKGGHSNLAVEGAGERILTLLSAALGRSIDPGVLGKIGSASAAWCDGEKVLALIHLARAGLPPLDDKAGYRLFAADRLLASGIDARTLLKACDIDTAALNLLKTGFNPDEPRVPSGNPDGGEWTDGEGSGNDPGSGSSSSPHQVPAGAGESGAPQQSSRAPRTMSGVASWYNLPGRRMANGKVSDPNAMTAAMRRTPLGTKVIVQSVEHPIRSITVVVTDRGPYAPGRIIDLTPAAFRVLFGGLEAGLGRVNVKVP